MPLELGNLGVLGMANETRLDKIWKGRAEHTQLILRMQLRQAFKRTKDTDEEGLALLL
jgi:hypothetical protein